MNDKDKKIIEEQDKLLDHLIEYGGHQYIDEEIKKYEELPELEPSKEFDERMNRMFQDAYKEEARHEHIRFGKKIAVIAIAAVGVISAAAMNIKAVREPVLNFVFHKTNNKNKTNINSNNQSNYDITFNYVPKGYKQQKVSYTTDKNRITYKFYNNKINQYLYTNIETNQDYDSYVNQSSISDYDKLTYKNHTYYFLSGDKNTLVTYKNHCIISIISSEGQSELLKIASFLKIKYN